MSRDRAAGRGGPAGAPPVPKRAPARSGSTVPPWAALCFVLSGAAGLLYEVVWSKQLAYLLGSSLHSVAVVVAAFLGGLALGARFLGGPLAHGGDPARRYALLELGVALLGLAILPLMRALDGPVGQLYRSLGGEGAPFAIARLVLVFLVLVPPAALMGATLPVLVARCEKGVLGSGLARLYAINTLGAVAGSLLGGFLLLPGFGLSASTFAAAALNLVAGAIAWTAGGPAPRPAPGAALPARAPEPLLAPRSRAWLGAVFALTGFAALSLQIAWVRLFSLVLGSTVYSFSAVLGVYLAGIALGSALAAPLLARVRDAGALAVVHGAIALAALAGIQAWPGLPGAMLEAGERIGTSWSGLLLAQVGLVLPVLLPPCLLMGAAFPLTARLLQAGEGGPETGRAYALNTAGTIAGSLVTAFAMLPWLGIQGSVLLAAALSALAAIACLLLPDPPRPTRVILATAVALLAVAGALAASAPRWDPMRMSLGTYRPTHAENLLQSFRESGGVGDPIREVADAHRVLFYKEGLNASVVVTTDLEGRRRWMRVGGKIDAGSGDMLTQVLLGLVPGAMADSGARTLIVGHGSGATTAAALAGGAGPTDVVELEPAVISGSRFFHEAGRDPLDDPRVTLHLEDARTRLLHGAGGYGLVISQPTNPWIAGVNSLFTVDFYRRVRAQLAPGGVFGQWLQVYEISPETFATMLGSFLDVFPEAHVFCLWRSFDVLLVAAPPGRALSLERLGTPAAREQLRRAGLGSALDLAPFYAGTGAAFAALTRGAARNTDDRPVVEYRAPRELVEVGRDRGGRRLAAMGSLPRTVALPAGGPIEAWPRADVLRQRARARLEGLNDAQAARVFEELRDAGSLALAAEVANEWSAAARRARWQALYEDAQRRLAAGEAAGASERLLALAGEPGHPAELWVFLARARRQANDVPGSGESARRALAAGVAGAPRMEALVLAAQAATETGRASQALELLRQAQREFPRDPRGYDLEAQILFTVRDLERAREVIERGLRQVPGDPALTQAAQVIARLLAQPR
jgi:spermidine synthase